MPADPEINSLVNSIFQKYSRIDFTLESLRKVQSADAISEMDLASRAVVQDDAILRPDDIWRGLGLDYALEAGLIAVDHSNIS